MFSFSIDTTFRAYQVANRNDLWHYLTESAQESQTFDNLTNVKDIMNAWTTKMGFPVVNVSRNYTTNEVEFTQNRFTFIAPSQWRSLEIKYDDAKWWIPLSYTTASEADFDSTKPKDWIRGTEKFTKDFENITNEEWLIVNIQGTGKKSHDKVIIVYIYRLMKKIILPNQSLCHANMIFWFLQLNSH